MKKLIVLISLVLFSCVPQMDRPKVSGNIHKIIQTDQGMEGWELIGEYKSESGVCRLYTKAIYGSRIHWSICQKVGVINSSVSAY